MDCATAVVSRGALLQRACRDLRASRQRHISKLVSAYQGHASRRRTSDGRHLTNTSRCPLVFTPPPHSRSGGQSLATYLLTYRAPRRRQEPTYLLFGTSGIELRRSKKHQTPGFRIFGFAGRVWCCKYPRKGGRVWVQHRQKLYMQNTCDVQYNVHWHMGGYGDSGAKGTRPETTTRSSAA